MGDSELLSAPLVIEYPFKRTTGPVIGAFLTAWPRQPNPRGPDLRAVESIAEVNCHSLTEKRRDGIVTLEQGFIERQRYQ